MSLPWTRTASLLAPVVVLGAALAAGCGGGSGNGDSSDAGATAADGALEAGPVGSDAGEGGTLFGNQPTLTSISIAPLTASITSTNGAKVSQTFTLQGKYSDGSVQPIVGNVTWQADAPLLGAMSAPGKYTANGALGGVTKITATYQKQTATADLTVKLLLQQNTGNIPPGVQTSLTGATTKDPAVTWAYPYDGTVFPRGLLAPKLQWLGGAATDDYYVHVTSPTFELQEFTTAPSAQIALDQTTWEKFTESSSGPTKISVARWDGTKATVITSEAWTIAPASMRGTIYYWSNNLGRVLRIKPGAAAPDDFLAAAGVSGCSTCHAVSADGSTLVLGGDVAASTYDLKTDTATLSGQGRAWAMPALSPDGKYLVENSSPLPGPPGAADGLWYTASGQRVANSGLDGHHLGMPAFAPDGTKIVYRDEAGGPTPGSLRAWDFDPVKAVASNDRELVPPGSNASLSTIGFPTVSPDAKWAVYTRGNTIDTRSGNDDLYLASTATAGQEVRLANVDGDSYPFAAGSRDLSWNYEPSFAPVAAGGYFWVVFTSRRTYGNTLTGPAEGTGAVKQLWVFAIDQNPKPGVDPSHPAFHLQGQDEGNLAMRGFWSLPPCGQNGASCGSGTDCCGGYCAGGADGGAPVCQSMPQGCSQDGDKCNTNADCCNAASGVTCIAHVCSEPTPQ